MLEKHAPRTRGYLRANHKLFIDPEISKAIMTRLRKCTLQLFCKQRNKSVSLLRKTKKKNTSLNEKRLTENKCFWKTVKTFLSCNVKPFERIKLAEEDDTLIINKKEVAIKLNDFFFRCCN